MYKAKLQLYGKHIFLASNEKRIIDDIAKMYYQLRPVQRFTSKKVIAVLANSSTDVYYQDKLLFSHESTGHCLVFIEWLINSLFLNQLDHFYHIHAGATASHGRGMIFPARNEVGKSTFTCFLTQKGFTCYSDEIALIKPATKKIFPYPKSISLIENNYKKVLGDFDQGTIIHIKNGEKVYYQPKLNKKDLKYGARLKYIFFLKREKTTNYPLQECSKGEGVIELVKNSFNPLAYSAKSFNQLTQLLSSLKLFHLDVSDLELAYQSICEVLKKDDSN